MRFLYYFILIFTLLVFPASASFESPVLVNFTPSTDVSIYQYETVNFYTEVDGSSGNPNPSTVTWDINSTTDETDTDCINATYDFVGANVGTYEIKATATNTEGSDTKLINVTVLPNSMTFSDIEYTPDAVNGTRVKFTVSDFTAGILIHGWNPTFNGTENGESYSWVDANNTILSTKTASSDGELLTFDTVIAQEGTYRIGILPTAGFSGTPTSGTVNTSIVTFSDSSLYADQWAWDFENDGYVDAYDQNPLHAYTIAGTYSVNLTASNDYGSDNEIKTAYILVSPNEGIEPFNWFYWFLRSHIRW